MLCLKIEQLREFPILKFARKSSCTEKVCESLSFVMCVSVCVCVCVCGVRGACVCMCVCMCVCLYVCMS
jgi:hypothetical protein